MARILSLLPSDDLDALLTHVRGDEDWYRHRINPFGHGLLPVEGGVEPDLEPADLGGVPATNSAQAPRGEASAEHLAAQLDADGVLTEPAPQYGPTACDYTRLCVRHQWASYALPERDLLSDCPVCLAELDAARGHERYRRLHARLAGR